LKESIHCSKSDNIGLIYRIFFRLPNRRLVQFKYGLTITKGSFGYVVIWSPVGFERVVSF